MKSERAPLKIPEQMRLPTRAWPIVHVQPEDLDLWRSPTSLAYLVSSVLGAAIKRLHNRPISGQVLLKVHVGEPNCVTRMRPEYAMGSASFLRDEDCPPYKTLGRRAVSGIVTGDTTVAYSGPRGYKENQVGDVSKYLQLAWKHGWSRSGKAGVPFVVLDRPATAKPGEFEFTQVQQCFEVEAVHHFKDFYVAGGFAAADFVVNNAHLTLHGLAGLAGCVKSIAMGCSGLTGKLRMHQSLLPHFDSEFCTGCGRCVESCPENALQLNEGDPCPTVDSNICIGCGECEAVCALQNGAIKLQGEEIVDWDRGGETLPIRMADYAIGLMNGKWDNAIHLLHMYAITERCDCLNIKQQPLLKRDLGFLIGKNLFAIDRFAAQILADALDKEQQTVDESLLKSVETTTKYIYDTYGILTEVPVERMTVS